MTWSDKLRFLSLQFEIEMFIFEVPAGKPNKGEKMNHNPEAKRVRPPVLVSDEQIHDLARAFDGSTHIPDKHRSLPILAGDEVLKFARRLLSTEPASAQGVSAEDRESILGLIAWLGGAAKGDRKDLTRGEAADVLRRVLASQPAVPAQAQEPKSSCNYVGVCGCKTPCDVAAPAKPQEPSKWTVTHNGKSVTADSLFKAMVAAKILRTDEEAVLAAENLLQAMDEELAPSAPAAPLQPPIFSQEHSDAMYRAGMILAGKMPQPSAPSVSDVKDAVVAILKERIEEAIMAELDKGHLTRTSGPDRLYQAVGDALQSSLSVSAAIAAQSTGASAVTQWADGSPPAVGWWDTKARKHQSGKDYEIRLWWNGNSWRVSPNSPADTYLHQGRQWRDFERLSTD